MTARFGFSSETLKDLFNSTLVYSCSHVQFNAEAK